MNFGRKNILFLVAVLAIWSAGVIDTLGAALIGIVFLLLFIVRLREWLVYSALVALILIPLAYFWQADWAIMLADIVYVLLVFYLLRRMWLDNIRI